MYDLVAVKFTRNLVVLVGLSAVCGGAEAHQAISGFIYPLECCNNIDCRQLDEKEVIIGKDYYIWKGRHIAFKSPKIRNSPDGFFHACENAHWGDTSNALEITCFFVPTNG